MQILFAQNLHFFHVQANERLAYVSLYMYVYTFEASKSH